MATRTQHDTVVFHRPLLVHGWNVPNPPGTYEVETEEELIEGLSFPAWKRLSTMLIRRDSGDGAVRQGLEVTPEELAALIAADQAAAVRR